MEVCRVCGSHAEAFDEARLLGKYDVKYFRCPSCGFIQTETPYWLEEAYSAAILDADIGLPSRNVWLSGKVPVILSLCLPECKSFLDYGGGYGMFVRLMRDAGFPFEWFDKYCENLFAKHFAKRRDAYDLVTAFELVEHLPNPWEEFQEILSLGENFLFMTELLPDPPPKVSDWWYYGTYGGQHIAFYTPKSLQYIAEKFQRHYVGCGNLHLFSKKAVRQGKFWFSVRFAPLIHRLFRKQSLLFSDYQSITGEKIM